MIFYTHVEHSPTKTIYVKYYTHTKKQKHTNLKTNQKLVRMSQLAKRAKVTVFCV